jgi:hypothetical protein
MLKFTSSDQERSRQGVHQSLVRRGHRTVVDTLVAEEAGRMVTAAVSTVGYRAIVAAEELLRGGERETERKTEEDKIRHRRQESQSVFR